ncbi:MAG: hypothetical protein Q8L48_08650 [Archangium sp.]|nr:hypothetical protein [Archangium sp.]
MIRPGASILTGTPTLPPRSALEATTRELLPGAELEWKETAAGLSLLVSGATVKLTAIPGPVPNAEADTSAFLSLSAVNGRWRLARHAAHLALTLEGPMQARPTGLLSRLAGDRREASQLERLTTFTRVVAAVSKAASAVGVYWAGGPVTHAPDFFHQVAKETLLPLPLWVGVSVTPEPGGRTSLLSFGMQQVSLPDLLLLGPSEDLADTVDFFFSALATIAERNRPPEEGETIARSLLSRPRVRYGPSPVDAAVKVWQLEL